MNTTHPIPPRLETPRPLLQKRQETDAEARSAFLPSHPPFCPFQESRPCAAWWSRLPLLLGLLALLALPLQEAQARRGLPPSMEFGLGLRLEIPLPLQADNLNLAEADWLSLPFTLGQATDPQSPFGRAALWAQRRGLGVCVSLQPAPGQPFSAEIVLQQMQPLLGQYPAIQVLELFPEANTLAGWGQAPSPQAYAALFLAVQRGLPPSVTLAAGGLTTDNPPEGMPAEDFLRGLYAAGLRPALLSIHLKEELPQTPGPQSLARLEALRAVMLENAHPEGTLWITAFSLPAAILSAPQPLQDNWQQQTLEMWRAQLYLGAVFEEPAPLPSPWERFWRWLRQSLGAEQLSGAANRA